MAEGENYVASVNQARQQGRKSRRAQASEVYDSLQAAADMDRLRGVDVGGFSGVTDTPAINVVGALASGGGGGTPVQTAGGVFERLRRGPGLAVPRQAQGSSPCANGRCGTGVGTSTVVGDTMFTQPSQSAKPSTPPAQASVGNPQATTVNKEMDAMGYLDLSRQATENMLATPADTNAADVRKQATAAGNYREDAMTRDAIEQRRHERDLQKKTYELDKEESAAANAKLASETRETNAKAQAVESLLPENVASQRKAIVDRAAKEGMTLPEFIDSIEALKGLTYQVQENGSQKNVTVQNLTPDQLAGVRDKLAAEFHGLQGIHMYINSEEVMHRAQRLSAADMVGRDPITGRPTVASGDADAASAAESSPAIQRSIQAIAGGFRDQGLLGKDASGKPVPWKTVQGAIASYVEPGLRTYLKAEYLKNNADDLESEKDPAKKRALQKYIESEAQAAGDRYLGVLQAELGGLNVDYGGLFPEIPPQQQSPAKAQAAPQRPAPRPMPPPKPYSGPKRGPDGFPDEFSPRAEQ